MPPRLPALRDRPIGFAHRGARSEARDNTLEAFSAALAHHAEGIESDVWRTADGVAVLAHSGFVLRRGRPRRIRDLRRAELPGHIPALGELYELCGARIDLSLDLKDAAAFDAVLASARAAAATDRLWLCHPDWELLAARRRSAPDIRLVDSTRRRRMRQGAERHAAAVANAGIDAVNLHHSDWNGGLTTLFHRFGRLAFAWDTQHDSSLDAALSIGIDAVYCDSVPTLRAAIERAYPTEAKPTDPR